MKRPVITILDTAPITDCYKLLEENGSGNSPS